MIRKLVLFGWLALLALVVAGGSGYSVVSGSDEISTHLLAALLAFGGLGLVFLCTAFYLLAMGRLVRNVTMEKGLADRWSRDHHPLVLGGVRWSMVGFASILAATLTGYPTHVGHWRAVPHHVLFYGTIALSVLALWRLRAIVTREEHLVRELDSTLEA